MAYSTGNPPRRITDAGIFGGGIATATAPSSNGNGGGSLWLYTSTHSSSEVIATGFFTGGLTYEGMRCGDVLLNFPLSGVGSSKMTMHPVIASSFGTSNTSTGSTYGGRFDVTVGTAT